jgi:hypothetical protein
VASHAIRQPGRCRSDASAGSTSLIACGRQRIVDLQPGIGRGFEPSLAILLKAPLEQSAHRHRRHSGQLGPVWIVVEHRCEQLRRRVTGEYRPPRQHFQQHDTERPQVAPPVGAAAGGLLRTHVGGVPRMVPSREPVVV